MTLPEPPVDVLIKVDALYVIFVEKHGQKVAGGGLRWQTDRYQERGLHILYVYYPGNGYLHSGSRLRIRNTVLTRNLSIFDFKKF